MPLNKRKNHKTAVKRAIKRRLIEISIRVEGYIYRNKLVTVEEAEKYIHEISIHQTKCNNDKHILQVIEKLTRCLKTIIEDMKKVSSHQIEVTFENNLSCDLLSGSSPYNDHEDNNKILDNEVASKVLSEIKIPKTIAADTIEIFDSDNEETTKKKFTKFPIFNTVTMEGSAKFNVNENITPYKMKSSDSNVKSINTGELVQTSRESGINIKNLKPNESYSANIVHNPNKIMNGSSKLTVANSDIKIKCKKKIIKKQTSLSLIHDDYSRMSKKKITLGFREKPLLCYPTSNLETVMNTKLNAQQTNNIVSKKNKKRISQKNVNNDPPSVTRKRKKSTNKTNITEISKFMDHAIQTTSIATPLLYAPSKYKHTQVDIICNEVYIPTQRVNNSEVRNIDPNQDSFTKQMGQLKIHTEHVLNDLSWIENIRYVREIAADEFDQTTSSFKDSWDNCLLPTSWTDDDFLH